MAVKHKSDSIQLIRDTEGIDNKDRVRILSPGSSPPKETTEVTEHALYMELENTPGDGEPYEYEFACASGRRFIPQRAGDANKLEGKTSAEVKAMFADGRAIFAGSGTSVTLDAEGDRVHSITVNGFTKQEGTGDASPVNVRKIVTGGMFCNKRVITGEENWVTVESYSHMFGLSSGTTVNSGVSSHYKNIGSGSFDKENGVYLSYTYNFRVCDMGCSTPEEFKNKLRKMYENGDPLIIWYNKRVNESDEKWEPGKDLYYRITMSGDEYRAKCVKINAPLCAGDKFISRTLSGCDESYTFDGSDDEGWFSNPSEKWFAITVPGIVNTKVLCDQFSGVDPTGTKLPAGCIASHPTQNSLLISYKGLGITETIEWKERLKNKPITVLKRSTSYTKDDDINVSLEVHQSAKFSLDGTETVTAMDPWYRIQSPKFETLGNFIGMETSNWGDKTVCNMFAPGNPYSVSEKNVAAAGKRNTMGENELRIGFTTELNPGSADNVKTFLQQKVEAGTPVEFVVILQSQVVYAHEPVDFEFIPGEDGVFTITGESVGTLDVYYKALQDGGDAYKLGGKLPEYYAAAANALGQYTHTKSGTVHELTGTGDNIRFVATADFAAGDTVKVNGTTCTASTMSGDALWAGFFKSGAVVVCYRTGNALNFSGGGLAAAEAAKITPENLKTGVSVTVNGKTVAGTFTADGTAAAGDMLFGKTGYVKGQKVTGTIPSKAAASYKPGTSAQTIKAVQYLSGDQTIEGDAALIAANIKYGASIFDVDGSFTSDANAVAAEILTGKIGYVKGQKITGSMPNQGAMWEKLSINGTVTIPAGYHNGQGKVTQSIPTKGAASYKPGTSAQTILSGQYLTGNQTIQGDGNLVAGNIRSGVSIFGVAGSFMEGSGGYLYMGQRNNTAMYGYAFGSASYSNGIRIGRSGNYLLVMFGYNETGATGRMKVNGSDVFAYGLNPAAVHTTTKWLNAGDIVTISADEGVNYALTGFVYNT